VIIQIYGFTDPRDVVALHDVAIDCFGVVLDEGFSTWDRVDATTARAITLEVPNTARIVALSLGTDVGRIAQTAEIVGPDIVHLARGTDMEPEVIHQVRERLGEVRIMTTVPVRDSSAIDVAIKYAGCSDYLLLDSIDSSTGIVGATGLTHDWGVSAQIPPLVDVPVILAGGLGPNNVREAIATVRPAGVDSETRTSLLADRRRKDVDAVRRFVQAARSM
jgi:phosphoribosylanthranilate isomerase